MTWWKPWTWWWRRPANEQAAEQAAEQAQAKLDAARAEQPRGDSVRQSFEAAVQQALARRHR